MPRFTRNYFRSILFIVSIFACYKALATHVVGGEMTYRALGGNNYEVTLITYVDYANSKPGIAAGDNPAFISVFNVSTSQFVSLDSISTVADTLPFVSNNPCSIASQSPGLIKRTFTKVYNLPANAGGYIFVNQKCCLVANYVNVTDPGLTGNTFACYLPAMPVVNNSAVFKNYPPQQICINKPLYFDHSGTDADGDSLSYGFCSTLISSNNGNNGDPALPPPFDSIVYRSPYSGQYPIDGSLPIQIDPATGIISGTPNKLGRYLMNVCCYEWRGGVVISTIRREFEFIVTTCADTYEPGGGNDTTIMVGDNIQFNATGSTTYSWTPGTFLTDPNIANPVGHFTEVGVFTYVLAGVSDSGCVGNDTIHVRVTDHSLYVVPSAFSPNGDDKNDVLKPIAIENSTLKSFKIFDRKGRAVFDTNDPATGWDGTYHSVKQDLGAYYWELLYIDNAGKNRVLKGSTTLVR